MANIKFEEDKAGIREIRKSAGMQAILKDAAQALADEANAKAEGHKDYLHIDRFIAAPYGSHVDVLDNTAVGQAHTRTSLSHKLEAKFNILATTNH